MDASKARSQERWKPGEPLPWVKSFWRDWLSDPAIRRMSPEQRGRFKDVEASTMGTDTPGVMTEEDVRQWAGLNPVEWKTQRETFKHAFNTTSRRGKWVLTDIVEQHKAAIQAFRTRQRVSESGVKARSQKPAKDNEIATDGVPTVADSAPKSPPPGNRRLDTDVQRFRTEASDSQTADQSAVPDAPPAEPAEGGLSSAGTGGTTAAHAALLRRALGAGCANGTGGTEAKAGGGL